MSSTIITVHNQTGNSYAYVAKKSNNGLMKKVYFSPDRSYVVAFFKKLPEGGAKYRLESIVTQKYRDIFTEEQGEYWKKILCWPTDIVYHEGKLGLIIPCYDSAFMFDETSELFGAEKTSGWFTSCKNRLTRLCPTERGTLADFLQVSMLLAQGVRRLHRAGMAHSDLSFNNVLVAPRQQRVCIIDIDGLVVPGKFDADVIGTPGMIAPEVLATSELALDDPRRNSIGRLTDQHSLAILIYMYLFARHPLEGRQILDKNNADRDDFLNFGEKALFIEHPQNHANHPSLDVLNNPDLPWMNTQRIPYTVLGPHLTPLFEQAFIQGLHNPQMRPVPDDWEEALSYTADRLLPCANPACMSKYFVLTDTAAVCPYCGTKYTAPYGEFVMYVSVPHKNGLVPSRPERRLTLYHGRELFRWQLCGNVLPNEKLNDKDRAPVARIKLLGKTLMMENIGLESLRIPGNVVPLGQSVDIRHKQAYCFAEEKHAFTGLALVRNQ